jgi:uncharacterized integral membrane protein
MIFVYLLMALIGVAASIFAIQNIDPVAVHFLAWSTVRMPLAFVILLSAFVGIVFASTSAFSTQFTQRRRIRQLEAQVAQLLEARRADAEAARISESRRADAEAARALEARRADAEAARARATASPAPPAPVVAPGSSSPPPASRPY